MSCEQSCGSGCNTAPDVWYKWVSGPAAMQTTFTTCNYLDDPINYPSLIYRYDGMILIYDNCPSAGGSQVPGGCSDDGCPGIIENIGIVILATVNPNTTYWIRISGWGGAAGNFTLRVNQP
jgi:hypothetical protein